MLFGQCPHGGGDKLKGASLTSDFNPHSTVLIYSDVKSSQSDGLGSGQWSIFLWFPKCAGNASLAPPIASLLRGWIKIILAFVCQTHSFFFLSFLGGGGMIMISENI